MTITVADWHLSEEVWGKSLKQAFARFEEQHPDINIKPSVVSYADAETRYSTQIKAGKGPDVFHLHGSIVPFASREYLQPLDKRVASSGGDSFVGQWYPKVIEQLQVDGTLYALPGDFMAMTMFYNKRMLKEAGLSATDLPDTWAEWREYAKALNRPDQGQWAFGTIGSITPGFVLRVAPVFLSHGARFFNEDGTCSALNTSEARKAFTFLVGLVRDGYVPPGVTSKDAGKVREQMANKQIAMAFGAGWTPPIVDALNPDLDAFDTLVTAPVPVDPRADPEKPTTAWLSWWAMNPNTEHQKQAWEVMRFITSQRTQQEFFEDNRVLSSRIDVSGARDGGGPKGYKPLVTDKFDKVIASQIPNARFLPKIPELSQALEIINTQTQRAYTGEAAPMEALRSAHEQLNQLLGGSDCPAF
ncbi:MAG: ABC transporter substrate-binding protein [Streptosporangiaceae bacterium]